MNTELQDKVIDQLGAENWEMVTDIFSKMNAVEIYHELLQMFDDDNKTLAQDIYRAINNRQVYIVQTDTEKMVACTVPSKVK